jgi:hypothetical protein
MIFENLAFPRKSKCSGLTATKSREMKNDPAIL